MPSIRHAPTALTPLLLVLGSLSLGSLSTAAEPPDARVLEGYPVTGLNCRLGEPLADFGPPLGKFHFTTAGAHDPGGLVPLPLSPGASLETLLATTADPTVLAVFDVEPEEIDPTVLNVPLRQVPANIDPAGDVRRALPDHFTVAPTDPNQTTPSSPITLGRWLEARGTALVLCHPDGSAIVDLRMRRLVPNRLYTVWAFFLTLEGPRPIPLGGAPNTFGTGPWGDGRFVRALSYCPFEPTEEGERQLTIDVVLHSDHQVYAIEPALARAGLPPGVVAHAQLEFRLAGEPLE